MKKIIFFSFLMLASVLHAQQKTIHKPAPIPVQPKPQRRTNGLEYLQDLV
jgi:hypothetical protein